MVTLSILDKCCIALDGTLKTFLGGAERSHRENPGDSFIENSHSLSQNEKALSASLMRVNHCGEVCAQALYQGQALTAKLPAVRQQMHLAAVEENDHLHWCQQRIQELGGHVSWLNPFFYTGSFAIGAIAGAVGDKWSLGFVAETEKQVVAHLDSHLEKIPPSDLATQAIVNQMREDEEEHAGKAIEAGAAELPLVVKKLMSFTAKVMTRTTYHV
ncbi:MAG: 2-polyprenyl-3-methyl-6-methoxy-1,4-benzoquinone monooxygenase [Pseudomonadota bacterium]